MIPDPSQSHLPSRAVFLVNMYMRGIHAGIQAGHALSKLHLAHPPGHPSYHVIESWDAHAPWFFVYNGGFASHLEASACALEQINRDLLKAPHPALPAGTTIPFARFHEGQEELNGALTAVAMIVPGALLMEDVHGETPEEFQALFKSSSRTRPQTAARADLPLEYRLNMLFHRLPYAI